MRRSGLNEIAIFGLGVALLFTACGGSAGTANTGPAASASVSPTSQPSPLNDFEKALQFVRNGQFTYIWVFSRKDGKPLDRNDNIFLKTYAPQVVDWAATDDFKKVVAGTNFNLEEGNLDKLKQRFVAEDYTGR